MILPQYSEIIDLIKLKKIPFIWFDLFVDNIYLEISIHCLKFNENVVFEYNAWY